MIWQFLQTTMRRLLGPWHSAHRLIRPDSRQSSVVRWRRTSNKSKCCWPRDPLSCAPGSVRALGIILLCEFEDGHSAFARFGTLQHGPIDESVCAARISISSGDRSGWTCGRSPSLSGAEFEILPTVGAGPARPPWRRPRRAALDGHDIDFIVCHRRDWRPLYVEVSADR